MQIVFFLPLFLFSQQQDNFPFHHIEFINSAQGLNGGAVYWGTQDRNGFLWFITDAGLNRFDGYSFRFYSYNPQDPDSPSPGSYYSLTEDQNGKLWMRGQQQGLYSFDPYHEKFAKYRRQVGKNSITDDMVTSMAIDEDAIWTAAASNWGIDKLDMKTMSFTHFDNEDTINFSFHYVFSMTPDKSRQKSNGKNLWIISNAGRYSKKTILSLYNTATAKVIEHYDLPFHEDFGLNAFKIERIKTETIWFGSDDSGIRGFNTLTRKFILIKPGHPCHSVAGHAGDIGLQNLYPVMEDHKGNLWTTNDDNEIVYYDREHEQFYFKPIPVDVVKFLYSTSFIFEDNSQKIWLCTRYGLIAIDTKQKQIITCRHNNDDTKSISGNIVYGIKRIKNGPLFVGTDVLDTFDVKSKTFSRFPLIENKKQINDLGVWTIFEDSKNNIWFGGVLRTTCYNRTSRKTRQYDFYSDDGPAKSFECVGIIEDRKGRYWVASFGEGFYALNPVTGKVRRFQEEDKPNGLSSNSLSVPFEDSRGIIYINAWDGGFTTFNPDSETFKVYHHDPKDPGSVSNDNDHVFLETKNGLIWFGTIGGGINVFNPGTGKFKAFTTRDGLAHNSVSSLIADKNGNYWAGTSGGLSCFRLPDDPFNSSCTIKFRNYNIGDGLPSNQLNYSSAFCDDDGTLYFGTTGQGMFYFHPDSLRDNDFTPPVYITEFRLKNQLVSMHDSNSILKSPIEFTKTINLNYRQNILSFSFAALNYIHPEKNQYLYMLENYDENWIHTDASKRFATYTNLAPGKYTFKVKASNNDDVWNETPTELIIIITPPFWQTGWFKIIVIVAIALVIYGIYRYRLSQITRLQAIRNKISHDLHDDIGSTLNSISVYSEVAKQDSAKHVHALEMIGESSRKIIDAMSDIVWTINPENDSFENIILRMRSLAFNLLRAKNIEFSFRTDESLNKLKLSMEDRRNFFLIFKESINNLVKYSEATHAFIRLLYDGTFIKMQIQDNGKGFDASQPSNGNGMNSMKQRAKEMNAQLKIESEIGKGTNIELIMKP